jgi:hypothetical protein
VLFFLVFWVWFFVYFLKLQLRTTYKEKFKMSRERELNVDALRNALKSSSPSTTRNFAMDDHQINELASLLGSINESEVPRETGIPARRSYQVNTSSSVPSRSNAGVGSSASALLQKALDRKNVEPRESREGRLPSTTGIGIESDRRRPISGVGYSSHPEISVTAAGALSAVGGDSDHDLSSASWRNRDNYTVGSSTTASQAPSNPFSSAAPNGTSSSVPFVDTADYTVVRFNTEYSMRSKQGKYLQTITEDPSDRDDGSVATFSSAYTTESTLKVAGKGVGMGNNTLVYLLAADGYGIGDFSEALQFVNLEQKDSTAPLMYGATVAIKSAAAKERLLGIKDGSRVGFWRHFVGEGEKWIVTKAIGNAPLQGCNGVTVPLTSLGIEDVSARHTRYVRVGDTILLQTKKSEHYLSIQDVNAYGESNTEQIKLIYKERGGLLGAQEALQIEMFGSVPTPQWLSSRPYLSGQMLSAPENFIRPSTDSEIRVFGSGHLPPHHHLQQAYQQQKLQQEKLNRERAKLKPLGEYSSQEQQWIILRDLLCLCAGTNGMYLRTVSSVSNYASTAVATLGSNSNSVPPVLYSPNNWGQVTDLQYVFIHRHPAESNSADIGQDVNDLLKGADASLIHQVQELLPFCTMVLHLRDFIHRHAGYDYGLVSHAFVRTLRKLLQDFDVLVCQLEHLHNGKKLTIQKLLFFLQPSRRMILVLYRVCFGYDLHNLPSSGNASSHASKGARDLVGGPLLQHLCISLQSQGDDQAKQLLHSLVSDTAAPFLTMISHWIYRGELHDPYREFMIQEDITIRKEALQADFNAQYWDHRYTLRNAFIPTALIPVELAQKILMTGKYLNVVRDCVGDAMLPNSSVYDDDGFGEENNYVNGDWNLAVSHSPVHSPKKHTSHQQPRRSSTNSVGADHRGFMKIVLPVAKKLSVDLNSLLSSFSSSHTAPSKAKNDDDDLSAYDDEDEYDDVGLDSHVAESETTLVNAVESTYRYASQTLLYLLESRYGLRAHLQSLGRFFLLEHGDFFIQFMDMAEDELRREVADITVSRLRHLLIMAVQTSTVAQDRHRDALSCTLAQHNLIQHLNLIQMAGELSSTYSHHQQSSASSTAASTTSAAQYASLLAQPTQGLKGIEALQLDYQVAWPASIVFSRRAITKYQLLSRLLYFSKHVERRLLHAWQGQQASRTVSRAQHSPLQMILRLSYTLRHRMLHFIQNFVYYMTLEVIHPRVTQLERDVREVTDMDRLLEIHEKFLDGCLRECLLANPELLKVLTKIMTTALLFSDHIVQLMETCHRACTPLTRITLNPNGQSTALTTKEAGAFTVSPLEKKRSQRALLAAEKNAADDAAQPSSSGNSNSKVDPVALARHRQLMQQRRRREQARAEILHQEMNHDACQRVMNKFAGTFDTQLKELLDGLWNNAYRQHAQLANLCVRLDYNGFYSSEFAT